MTGQARFPNFPKWKNVLHHCIPLNELIIKHIYGSFHLESKWINYDFQKVFCHEPAETATAVLIGPDRILFLFWCVMQGFQTPIPPLLINIRGTTDWGVQYTSDPITIYFTSLCPNLFQPLCCCSSLNPVTKDGTRAGLPRATRRCPCPNGVSLKRELRCFLC
jgi:hypothetical protein